ncbi:PREDICTED: uncharacterized protein LOC105147667 [Acromyrmex echinatior]|uniref:uncharacterized protein LOC105147667 n=1 Tax=Acromyrmex echinatior TaxID=103372 RepID=UPI000580F146|nr:PREDICTED: uncharacterized protein LOC105147667 [Acromyrmex echinatior]
MEFSRNENDELRSPEIMARSITAGMLKADGGGLGVKFRARKLLPCTTSFLRHRARFEKLPSTDTNTYKGNFIADLTIVPVPAVCHKYISYTSTTVLFLVQYFINNEGTRRCIPMESGSRSSGMEEDRAKRRRKMAFNIP